MNDNINYEPNKLAPIFKKLDNKAELLFNFE